jgi:large subunit ribosomal protein L19
MEVEVYQIIKEWNKQRVQRFKGLVIKVAGKSELDKTITVRRKVWAFGVEKVFVVHSSNIEKIEIIRQFKVRRKSIKYIRDLTGKAARLKEIPLKNLKEIEVVEEEPKKEQKQEEIVENVEKTKETPKEEKIVEVKEAPKTETKDEIKEDKKETEKKEEK